MGCKCIKPNINNEDEIKSHQNTNKNEGKNNISINQNQTENTNNLKSKNQNDENFNIIDYDQNSKSKNQNNKNEIPKNDLPKDDFSKYLFEQINKIRKNPKSFIPIIEESKNNITIDKNDRLIYKSKVKVALTKGKPAFDEAISFLENTESMDELIFNSKMCIPVPTNEKDIKDKHYFKDKVDEIINNNIIINTYWRDIIKDPETCFILMIVDDTGIKSGMKRNDLLDPKKKYIGISSVMIGKSFVCYMTLSEKYSNDD